MAKKMTEYESLTTPQCCLLLCHEASHYMVKMLPGIPSCMSLCLTLFNINN